MKICKNCNKTFNPSSRHFNCPKCREILKKRKCIECGTLIFFKHKRCKQCNSKLRIGIKLKKDEYTGFRDFLNRAKRRNKLGNLSLQDILDVWNNQKGICIYSGVLLVLPNNRRKNDPIYVASLDRIDSNLPYEKGNIQFVSCAINHMKGEMSHNQTIELCKIITEHWKNCPLDVIGSRIRLKI